MRVLFLTTSMVKSGVASSIMKLTKLYNSMGIISAVATPKSPPKTTWKNYELPYVKNWNFLQVINSKKVSKKLEEIINEFKPDILHVNNINGLSLAPIWIAKEKRIPIIITLRDYYWICGNSMFWRNSLIHEGKVCTNKSKMNCFMCGLESMKFSEPKSILNAFFYAIQNVKRLSMKKYLKEFNKVICITKFQKKLYSLNNSILIYNMYYPANIKKLEKPPQNGDYYITGGRFKDYKGFQVAIKAFKKMPKENLIVCGEGPYKNKLLSIAKDAKNIIFKEFLSQKEFLELAASSKGLIIPSVWYEGCPNLILDALKLRIPVLGSNHGGMIELIKNGKTGYLFNPGDEKDLIKKVISTNKFKINQKESKKILELFNPKNVAKQYIKVYKEVIKEVK